MPTRLMIDRNLEAVAEAPQAMRLAECALALGLRVCVLERNTYRDKEPMCAVPVSIAGTTGIVRREGVDA